MGCEGIATIYNKCYKCVESRKYAFIQNINVTGLKDMVDENPDCVYLCIVTNK